MTIVMIAGFYLAFVLGMTSGRYSKRGTHDGAWLLGFYIFIAILFILAWAIDHVRFV